MTMLCEEVTKCPVACSRDYIESKTCPCRYCLVKSMCEEPICDLWMDWISDINFRERIKRLKENENNNM